MIYRSANGDDWLLATDESGVRTVVHRANPASGGTQTTMPVEEFLERGGGSPEAAAVRAALAAPPADDGIGRNEDGAPGLSRVP
ncbi:hypothetical protein Sa4125_17380 [Aureimonas sp. SA4125]|uniref:hypothetical protein n=1 Tax=Aureimonas sp. SA4125 TaxID=2826993 RepID=UPI001CC6D419|nr:hypothetical protein [Aureimonas sp. SA4125]BDA84196.1 hypothetical protein Sa4125_17380 [Aureimonas sp. SA4125]